MEKTANRPVSKDFIKVKHAILTASARHYQTIKNLVGLYGTIEAEPAHDKHEIKRYFTTYENGVYGRKIIT